VVTQCLTGCGLRTIVCSCGASWTSLKVREVIVVEEAGCQACEKLPPGERVCWEVVFSQRESSTSYRALRLPDPACCRDPEREVKH
jgi:hypothetical protein